MRCMTGVRTRGAACMTGLHPVHDRRTDTRSDASRLRPAMLRRARCQRARVCVIARLRLRASSDAEARWLRFLQCSLDAYELRLAMLSHRARCAFLRAVACAGARRLSCRHARGVQSTSCQGARQQYARLYSRQQYARLYSCSYARVGEPDAWVPSAGLRPPCKWSTH